jgi:hypothetical protein
MLRAVQRWVITLTRTAERQVREEIEIERLVAALSDDFEQVPPNTIEQSVRDAFQRRSAVRVKDFLPIFVERDLRRELRGTSK